MGPEGLTKPRKAGRDLLSPWAFFYLVKESVVMEPQGFLKMKSGCQVEVSSGPETSFRSARCQPVGVL